MLLKSVRDEFVFHCQSRKLSPKTVNNYTKQLEYLINYLEVEKDTKHIDDVEPKFI